jgi:hypothetical protein
MSTKSLKSQNDLSQPSPLPTANTTNSFCIWIKKNTMRPGGITPRIPDLPDGMKEKGLYFWFINPKCYEKLSGHVKITPLKEVCVLDGYHLVYIGSSGTGKQGKATIYDRMIWHLADKHNKNTICHGTLSTFRGGLASLIADDLILPTTESDVNELLAKCFKLYYIPYDKDQWKSIDADEKKLIKEMRPLLNIRNNPNAHPLASANSTQTYRKRRLTVYSNSRKRHCVEGISEQHKKTTEPTPRFEHQILKQDGCTEYMILDSQNIHVVTNGILHLPTGPCIFVIYDPKTKKYIYAPKRGTWRSTGKGKQNIYTYFRNVAAVAGPARWQVIQNEMIKLKIKEAVVVVCPDPGKPWPPPPLPVSPVPNNKK